MSGDFLILWHCCMCLNVPVLKTLMLVAIHLLTSVSAEITFDYVSSVYENKNPLEDDGHTQQKRKMIITHLSSRNIEPQVIVTQLVKIFRRPK
jgi:hypothetical protein